MKKRDIIVSNEKEIKERLLDFKKQDDIQKELSKNRGFTQMYFDKLDFSLNGNEMKTFLYLCSLAYCNLPKATEYAYVVISFDRLSEGLHISKQVVQKSIKSIKDKKLIKIFKSGKSNVYAINPYVMWKSDNNSKWKALYNKTEQEFEKLFVVKGTIVLDKK